MTKSSLEAVIGNVQAFGQRKIKVAPFIMVSSVLLLVTIIIYMIFYVTGRQPNYNPLPAFRGGTPEYQYSFFGPGEMMLMKPMGITVFGNKIYVTDTMNNRVQVFAPNGDQLLSFGSFGRNPGEFDFPYGIAVSQSGEIYVADSYNGEISVFDENGNFLRYCGQRIPELNNPAGLLLYKDKLYVANLDPGYVLIVDPVSDDLLGIFGEDDLSFPNALTAGPDGNLYISDTGNNRIQVYNTEGIFVSTFIDDSGSVDSPRELAFDSLGRLFVVNKMYGDIVIFNNKGEQVGQFGDNLQLPNGLAVDSKGGVYVTDHISVSFFQ